LRRVTYIRNANRHGKDVASKIITEIPKLVGEGFSGPLQAAGDLMDYFNLVGIRWSEGLEPRA